MDKRIRRRYTDEELSRILSEHEVGRLENYGGSFWEEKYIEETGDSVYVCKNPKGCINQVAFNEDDSGTAVHLRPNLARWFDHKYPKQYKKKWTTDRFLKELDKVGA